MRISGWFRRFSQHFSVVALALFLATMPSSAAANGRIGTAIKQAVPKVSQQLVKGAKLALACGVAICTFGVALPAVQADQQAPPSESQVAPAEMPFIPFTGSWSAATGAYTDSFEDYATFDVTFKGRGNFRLPGVKDDKSSAELLFLTSFRFKPEEIDTLDATKVLPVTYASAKILLFDRGEGKMSYGYSDSSIAALMNSMWSQYLRNYVGHYKKGVFQFALLGYEYFDNLFRVVETDDPARGSHVSLYRGGLEQYVPVSNNVLLQAKLESSLGLGNIGGIDLGGVRQDRIEATLDAVPGMGSAEIRNSLYHEGSARLMAILAQGRHVFFVNVLHGTTIDGLIEAGDAEVGDFSVSNNGIEMYGKVGIIDNISIEAMYSRYRQTAQASLGEQEIVYHESDGHLGFVQLVLTVNQ